MTHPFETQLAQIRDTLLTMSGLAESNFARAMTALAERSNELAHAAEIEDNEIDKFEITVDEQVITYMATHAPVATDCRLMLAASKISSNLERIGDQSTTIARRTRELNSEPLLNLQIDIPTMAQLAQQMLHDSITAFVEADRDLAQDIIARDKVVDDLNKQLGRELTSYMIEHPQTIMRCLNTMTIVKCIERIADHAQNIAEEVFYLYSGKDIRHDKNMDKLSEM